MYITGSQPWDEADKKQTWWLVTWPLPFYFVGDNQGKGLLPV